MKAERSTPSKSPAIVLGSEDSYRLLVESLKDYAIIMLDPGGLVASWNAGAERFKGYSAEELIGYLLIGTDNTVRKQIEAGRAALNTVAFVNLIGNAVKFTEKGGVSVRVGIKAKTGAVARGLRRLTEGFEYQTLLSLTTRERND